MAGNSKKTLVGWFGALIVTFAISACGSSQPPPEPEPEPEPVAQEEPDDSAAREAEERRRREAEERRRAEAERQRVMEVLAERVHFEFDKSDIRGDAEPVLQRKITVLREYSDIEIRIAGNCDERGSVEYNLALGQRRAEAVRRYMMSYGLAPSRFTTISYGEERPLDTAHSERAWQRNRRADFSVTDAGSLGSSD